MPLGNGRLGLAVWTQDGYTAQLNRGDTFPLRLSPGQVVIPGLKKLTEAADYLGRLNLYDGQFEEQGGGTAATTYVDAALDVMAVDVTGADPNVPQTAELKLWEPRHPHVFDSGRIGILAETWLDNKEAGASGDSFGSLAAITADATDLRVEKSGPYSVRITFRPHPDGTFRILVGSPAWHGGDAPATASKLLDAAEKLSPDEHRAWWNQYWSRVGLMKLSSPDHAAEYFENLRTIDLFTAAAEGRDRLPGGQAGIGDLFSAFQDTHQWGPSAYWHWNLRMQVSANLGAGTFDLNQPYFNLYRENLTNILAWTRQHMGGRNGACIPETMRFNGRGYENETWVPKPAINCGQDSPPYYNARTISTGAEVSHWVWQQYLFTDDLDFLRTNYPLMRESARFLLAYASRGKDGKLHTFPSNAHETQWDVHDPTTDILAMHALFPAVIQAASLLKTDGELVAQLKQAIPELPEWPLVRHSAPGVLVPNGANDPDTVIAASYDPAVEIHNSENIGLEPVWPYGFIGDDGPLHQLGVRTYLQRPNKNQNDWSYDPVQAARLGLTDEFKSSLLALTEKYQAYPSGMAKFVGPEFYVEQTGIVADALQNALAQDYDGLLRIAPAWPKDWDADATVFIQHRGKVHLQIHKGELLTVGIEAGASGTMRVRNPWPGEKAELVNARTAAVVLPSNQASVLEFPIQSGGAYTLRRTSAPSTPIFEVVSGIPATAPKTLGSRSIGIGK
ncbi:glycosyl hydrolase family 95 catalytic domain-containing protein [Alloacidobacterium sp.]|uniref:glycosyl hydrolase family 95 catalytic domain-containing protein n=1 Tax=Alloacidobacterium sp. TaxID=2951999 RepID=UPI002D6C34FE|nr:glycoside hydrolase [Alloacidobacterium sp.]HYK36246.1 glycoside hydrolase [Alloacidobacterium sp.]